MSSPATTSPRSATRGTPVGVPWRQRVRTGWVWVLLVVALAALSLLAGRPDRHPGVVDPDDAHPSGGRALAQVLRHDGIDVQVVRSASAVQALARGPQAASTTLVLMGDPGSMADPVIPPDGFAHQVLMGLSQQQADRMGLPAEQQGGFLPLVSTDCAADIGEARTISAPQWGFGTSAGWQGCFPIDATLAAVVQRGDTTLVSNPDLFTNDHITRADNAALAVHLLGRDPHLVWYVPSRSSAGGSGSAGESISSLLPRAAAPLRLLLLATALVTMLWRGRRLGRLVREPLPVEVPALETTLNRARLHRAAGDHGHALEALQRGTRKRLADRLGVRASDDPERDARDLVLATCRALPPGADADPVRVHHLLYDNPYLGGGASTTPDAGLIDTARALLDLEHHLNPQNRTAP